MIMVNKLDKKDILEKLHKKMISEIQDFAIILMDLDGTILSWNIGAEMIKGYKESEIIGQNFRIFYLPSDRQAELPDLAGQRVIRSEGPRLAVSLRRVRPGTYRRTRRCRPRR